MATKKHKDYPKPGGPEVEFVLMANDQYKKGEHIPLNVNGYEHHVVVGGRNKLPQDVLQVLLDAKSKTQVTDTDRYDPSRGGVPRKQEDFYNPVKKDVYQCEYDIEILNGYEERKR